MNGLCLWRRILQMLRVVVLLALALIRTVAADLQIPIGTAGEVFRGEKKTIELPFPDGMVGAFTLEPVRFMAGDNVPIRVFRSVDRDGSSASLVVTPESIAAQVFYPGGTVYVNSRKVDPGVLQLEIDGGEGRSSSEYQCLTPAAALAPAPEGMLRQQSVGTYHPLRTFRLAPGATAEFTEYFGSKEEAVRQVVTAMARANEIFRRELGINFELVTGFERMIFTDPVSDPFSSNDPTEDTLKETQAAFDAIIGTENYDLGIVLTRGTFGLAYIRSVCDPKQKGSSCIGLPEPAGDAFHVNLVTHELAHQFGANHTFNSPTGLCSERRNDWAAFEPGAGSTIMSYSSLPCGDDSFQPRHDAYFHSESLKEIRHFINSPAVTCAVLRPSGNSPPIVSAGPEYTIPVGTPFALTASASDPDGDEVTYCWEERDLGPAQTLGAPDNGLSPRFRSRPPSASPTRIFPALEHVLAGSDSPEERLPEVNRVLRFRVVARDAHQDGAISWADTQLYVTNFAGPFRITSHGAAATLRGSTRLEWNTGGTERAPISARQVRITLSTNGGLSYPIVLAEATPNDGSEDLTLPAVNSANARLKVEPTNNIFFDVNDAPLAIVSGESPVLSLDVVRGRDGRMVISWMAKAGTNYRVERAGALPPTVWSEVLTTNAPGSSVSLTVSASADSAYYRVLQQ
jgi:hypothetical protein